MKRILSHAMIPMFVRSVVQLSMRKMLQFIIQSSIRMMLLYVFIVIGVPLYRSMSIYGNAGKSGDTITSAPFAVKLLKTAMI